MSRWPVLTVLSIGSLLLACADRMPPAAAVRPGLANGPRLGGTGVADERLSDVVANGDDACGVRAEQEHGPLRGRVPPCPTVKRPERTMVLPGSMHTRGEAVTVPWVEHHYAGWPCPPRKPVVDQSKTLCAMP
jgi:hypothetical protein